MQKLHWLLLAHGAKNEWTKPLDEFAWILHPLQKPPGMYWITPFLIEIENNDPDDFTGKTLENTPHQVYIPMETEWRHIPELDILPTEEWERTMKDFGYTYHQRRSIWTRKEKEHADH